MLILYSHAVTFLLVLAPNLYSVYSLYAVRILLLYHRMSIPKSESLLRAMWYFRIDLTLVTIKISNEASNTVYHISYCYY